MKELTLQEVEQVNGGLAFLMPMAITAAKWSAGISVGAASAFVGYFGAKQILANVK